MYFRLAISSSFTMNCFSLLRMSVVCPKLESCSKGSALQCILLININAYIFGMNNLDLIKEDKNFPEVTCF